HTQTSSSLVFPYTTLFRSLMESLKVIKDIARALDYAGRKGYVHRDVKPENIMLLNEDGRAVLMDFGIARPSDVASGMTQTGSHIDRKSTRLNSSHVKISYA